MNPINLNLSDETETSFQEEKETKPTTAEDIFKILHGWDDEPTDWWTITKKKKEYEEWMKPMKEGTIRRVRNNGFFQTIAIHVPWVPERL